MGFSPDTKVEDMVVLVTDPNHPQYGQIGVMSYHDWGYGDIDVEFSDGHIDGFYEGMMKGGSPSQINRYYRRFNEKGLRFDRRNMGPEALQIKFLELGMGDLESLAEQYKLLFREDLPPISFLRKLPLELLIKFKEWFRRN